MEALGDDGAADAHSEELDRIQRELEELKVRIRRQVANQESEEPGTELAREILRRIETPIGLRSKEQAQLDAARRWAAEHPRPATAQRLLEAFPLVDVDWQLLQDHQFRDLLGTLAFEARFDPKAKMLKVSIVLTPELPVPRERTEVGVSFVPPVGFEPTLGRF